MGTPVIKSYGMGVDSSAWLVEVIENPAARVVNGERFELEDLIVLTAMTGNEFDETRRLVETHVLPLLRENGVRFVQVARKSREMKGGMDSVVVLDDSRCPEKLHIAGAYKLSDEMHGAGTVPQFANGKRLCSVKFKGYPLDAWIEREMDGAPFVHVMGFNADEESRAARDTSYSTGGRTSVYPLIEWGWGREKVESYLEERFEKWAKSCCTFCPFAGSSGGKRTHLVRLRTSAEAATDGMFMEYVSMAFNEYMPLFAGPARLGLISSLRADGNTKAAEAFERRLESAEWHVYLVRRLMVAKGRAHRSIKKVSKGAALDRDGACLKVLEMGEKLGLEFTEDDFGVCRAYGRRRTDKDAKGSTLKAASYPTAEAFLVAVPTNVDDKEKARFTEYWDAIGELGKVESFGRRAA